MFEKLLLALAGVIVLGIGAHWLAWRLRVPSILLLLATGFLAGPLSRVFLGHPILDTDELMQHLLLPFVSLSVAVILYEGGLSLRFRELRGGGAVLWRLVTIGAAVTWVLAAAAASILLGLSLELSILLGAILVVTGPTVVIPLLREIRPKGRVAAIAKWEGIVIDPIGAMLAVLVFEVILLGTPHEAANLAATVVGRTLLIGGGLGVVAGFILALMLRAYWIPHDLESAVSLMFVVAVYTAAHQVQPESGLLAATAMGMTLANQRFADVRHIVEFKENLRVLLISTLFILLAARLRLDTLADIGPATLVFLAVLIAIVRPLSVLISTLGSSMTLRENVFLALMAPRGIVAASVASVFALRLADEGFEDARKIVPLTFTVIFGTVLFSSLVLPTVARRLRVADPSPQGVLFVGAHAWARMLAAALNQLGFRVLLVDTNRMNVAAAREQGLDTHLGSIIAEHVLEELDLGGIGNLIAVTPNDSVNVLAVQRFVRIFGRSGVFQIPPSEEKAESGQSHRHLHGRWFAGHAVNSAFLAERVRRGAVVKATVITGEFTLKAFRDRYGEKAIPLFVVTEAKKLIVMTDDQKTEPRPGQTLVCLIDADAAVVPEPSKSKS